MKKNLTAIFVASSVGVISLGSTLAAYGTDEISGLISSIVSGNAVKPEGSIDNDNFSYDPDTETLTIKTDAGFDEYKVSVPQEFVSTVAIDNSIVTIKNDAFKGCTNLKRVDFTEQSALKTIGDSAFEGCTALEQIGYLYVDDYKWNHKLQEAERAEVIQFPGSLEGIGENAFKDCTGLKSIYFGSHWTLNCIKDGAFENCTSLTELDLPMGCQQIGSRAFNGCTGIKYLRVNNGLNMIGASAFEGCTDLRYADLKNCYNLEIGEKAFADCHFLWKIELGSGSLTIKNKAFYNTYCEGILLPQWWSYDTVSIAGDIFECSEEYAKTLKNPTKYIIYSTDNINRGFATLPDCIKNLPDSIVRLSYYSQIYDPEYNGGTWVSLGDGNGNSAVHLTIESKLPEEGTVIVPETIGGFYESKVIKVMDKNGDELDSNKYEMTYNPSLLFWQDGDTKNHLKDNVEEPSGGFNIEPEPTPPPEESSDSSSSVPTSSEPTPSRPTPPPSRPESSEPESSETESSEPESSEPESSEPESGEPESSEPTSINSEDESNPSNPTDVPHGNSDSVGSVPNPPDNSSNPNPPDKNPNTGARFLAPAIVAGAAIVAVAARRRKMK